MVQKLTQDTVGTSMLKFSQQITELSKLYSENHLVDSANNLKQSAEQIKAAAAPILTNVAKRGGGGFVNKEGRFVASKFAREVNAILKRKRVKILVK